MNKFTVPKPCHEKWENMLPKEKGRFCTSCKTKVYDFSESSDAEIQEIYEVENGNICGRFSTKQLVHYSTFQKCALRFQTFTQNKFSRFGILVSAASLLVSISGCTKKTDESTAINSADSDSSNLSIVTVNEITLGAPLPARKDSAQIPKVKPKKNLPADEKVPIKIEKPKPAAVKSPTPVKDINIAPPRSINHEGGFPLGKIAPVRNAIVTEPLRETPPITVGKPMRAPEND